MKNEEKIIKKLLDTLKPFLDLGGKVYALDTGSEDDTVKVAESYGVQVFKDESHLHFLNEEEKNKFKELVGEKEYNKWSALYPDFSFFNFMSARNKIAEIAETDWLLTVDADEFFLNFDFLYLDMICRTSMDDQMFSFPYIWARKKTGGEIINYTTRVWNKKKSAWVRYVHEHIDSIKKDQKQKGAPVTMLDKDKLFMEHCQNKESSRTNERSSRIFGLFKDYIDHPNIPRATHYLGRELMYYKQWEAAIKLFDLNISHETWDVQKMCSYVYKGDCQANLGLTDKAVLSWFQGFNVYNKTRLPAMRLAQYYYTNDNKFMAKIWAEISIQIDGCVHFIEDPSFYRHLPHEILYWAYYWSKNIEKAKEHYKKAVEFFPDNPKYKQDAMFFN